MGSKSYFERSTCDCVEAFIASIAAVATVRDRHHRSRHEEPKGLMLKVRDDTHMIKAETSVCRDGLIPEEITAGDERVYEASPATRSIMFTCPVKVCLLRYDLP